LSQIAAIIGFAGALSLGRMSTDTMGGDIASISAFQGSPRPRAAPRCDLMGC
jgi:hypothetical protein